MVLNIPAQGEATLSKTGTACLGAYPPEEAQTKKKTKINV